MATWSDGLRWDAAELRASADEQARQSAALRTTVHHVANSPTGRWEGAASRAASKSRQGLVDQGTELVGQLSKASSTYADAASRLSRLLSDMMAVRDRAHSDNFRINDNGSLEDLVTGWRQLDPRRAWSRTRVWSSVQSIVFRLTGFDVWFAAQLGLLDVFVKVANTLVDGLVAGAQFLNDRVDDGMDWAKERWEDVEDFAGDVRDGLVDRWNAFRAGSDRYWEAATDPPRWVEDLFLRGELPEVAEVLATGTYLEGLRAGTLANLITGKDHKFFADGVPFTGEPIPMGERDGRSLQSVGDWMQDMKDVYGTRDKVGEPDGRPSVEITVVENPGQPPRIVLTVPGTTESLHTADGWTGHPGGTDWSANLRGVGYGSTATTQAIMDAVDKVAEQYPGASEIIMGGHSQGGIIVANMAADPDFSSRYDIAGIMTAGSPIQTIPIPHDIPVMNVSAPMDPVPKADLGGYGGVHPLGPLGPQLGTRDGGNVLEVPMDASRGGWVPVASHDQQVYVDKVQHIMDPSRTNLTKVDLAVRNFDSAVDHFYATDTGKVTTYQVEVGRQHE